MVTSRDSRTIVHADRLTARRQERCTTKHQRLAIFSGGRVSRPGSRRSRWEIARATLGEERFVASRAEGQLLTIEESAREVWATVAARESSLVSTAPEKGSADHGLTRREVEVLRLVASGLTNREIAGSLYISIPAIKRRLSNIYGKLGVTSRVDASARARGVA